MADNRCEEKSGYIILKNTDSLIHYIDNFCFIVIFFAKSSSYLYLQWSLAKEILEDEKFIIASLELFMYLTSKILYYLHTCMWAYLWSCTEASIIEDVDLGFLDWEKDLTSLI